MMPSTPARRARFRAPLFAAFLVLSGPLLPAQDRLAGLRGTAAEARTALAALPAAAATEPEVVAAVVALMARPDADLKNRALAWLRRHPACADAAFPPLLALREHRDPDVLRAAEAAMTALRPHRSMDPQKLGRDLAATDRNGRARLMQELQRLPQGGLEILPQLVPLAEDPQIATLLGRLAEKDRPAVVTALTALLTADPPPQAPATAEPAPPTRTSRSAPQTAALAMLATLQPDGGTHLPATAALLDRALAGNDVELRRASVRVLGTALGHGADSTAALARAFERGDPNGRQEVLNSLINIGLAARPLWPTFAPSLGRMNHAQGVLNVLLGFGSEAREHVDDLVAALGTTDDWTASLLADGLCQIAPEPHPIARSLASRLLFRDKDTVARLLLALPTLGEGDAEVAAAVAARLQDKEPLVRRCAIVALGRLRRTAGPHLPALAAAANDPDPATAALARLVQATFAPGAAPPPLAANDPLVTLVALAMLRQDRTATPPRTVLPVFVQPNFHGDGSADPHLLTSAHRMAVTEALLWLTDRGENAARAALSVTQGIGRLQTQDRLRAMTLLSRSGQGGIAELSFLLRTDWLRPETLRLLGQLGPAAAAHVPDVAAFLHDPRLRELAAATLRAVGGDPALAGGQALPDPWPAFRALDRAPGPVLAFAADPRHPAFLRLQCLERLRWQRPDGRDPALAALPPLLTHPGRTLRLAAAEVLCLGTDALHQDPELLRLFASGDAHTRALAGGVLRAVARMPLHPALARTLLRDGSPQHVGMAVEALRSPDVVLDLEWLRESLADPEIAPAILGLLGDRPAQAAELVPELLPLLADRTHAAAVGNVLLLSAAGRAALLERQGSGIADTRLLAAVAEADADARPFVPAVQRLLRAPPGRANFDPSSSASMLGNILVKVRWLPDDPERTATAELIARRWRATSERDRAVLLPLVVAMGPALAPALADDLHAMLAWQDVGAACGAADALVALGDTATATAWLQARHQRGEWALPQYGNLDLLRLHKLQATLIVQHVVEVADADLLPPMQVLGPALPFLTAADRSALAARVLAAETDAARPATTLAGIVAMLLEGADGTLRTHLAAFWKRRATIDPKDPFAVATARAVLTAVPELALPAADLGFLERREVLTQLIFRPPSAPTGLAADLIQFAQRGQSGEQVGRALRAEADAALPILLAQLPNDDDRPVALQVLRGLGPTAAKAVPDLGRFLLASDNLADRTLLAEVLANAGPAGINWLEAHAAADPNLRDAVVHGLRSNDPATLTAAARAVGALRPAGAEPVLRQVLQLQHDGVTRSWLLLALLVNGAPGDVGAWLHLPGLPAPLVRRTALRQCPVSPLLAGVLVECLDDADPEVANAAARRLLEDDGWRALTAAALRAFAARTDDAALRTRIEAALGG